MNDGVSAERAALAIIGREKSIVSKIRPLKTGFDKKDPSHCMQASNLRLL